MFFAPVLGRGGTAAPPDLIVAALMTVVAGVLGHPLIVMLVYPSNPTHVPTPKAPHKDVGGVVGGSWFVLGLGVVVAASMLFTAHAPAYTAGAGVRLVSSPFHVSLASRRKAVRRFLFRVSLLHERVPTNVVVKGGKRRQNTFKGSK